MVSLSGMLPWRRHKQRHLALRVEGEELVGLEPANVLPLPPRTHPARKAVNRLQHEGAAVTPRDAHPHAPRAVRWQCPRRA